MPPFSIFSIISDLASTMPLIFLKFSMWASPTLVITATCGLISLVKLLISPALLIPKFFNKSFIKFFKDVLPALPVTAIILAREWSLLDLAKRFKKDNTFLIFIIFLSFIFIFSEQIIQPAFFFSASLINLFPLFFLPLIARNKLSFLRVLVSIESPSNFNNFFLPKILLSIELFWW